MALKVRAAALAACVALAGCTGSGEDDVPAIESPSPDTTATLRVWLMKASQPGSVLEAAQEAFAEAYPNVEVEVELQQWSGIQERLAEALASEAPPDVVEIGNTITARFAGAGQLAALDPAQFDVAGMLPGLQPSGELDGQRYGIPYYGGVRVVVYRKSHFKDAGVEVPGTLAELADAAAALQADHADEDDYSAFYFPGRYWYGALPFIWDAGGDIAVQAGADWTGTLDSPESQAGLATLADLVSAYSKAPADADEGKNIEAFASGGVGMMIDSWWAPGVLNTGKLAGDVGAFALPGSTAERTAPVFFGGSDLAVAANSANKGLAAEWVQLLAGRSIQTLMARDGGVIPNQEGAFEGHAGNPFLAVADEAALVSRFTPVSPNWGNVESSAVIPDMLQAILSGEASIPDATASASEDVAATLNG